MVKHVAHFNHLRHGIAYYLIRVRGDDYPPNGKPFLFPVPLDDIGDATLHWEEKGIMLMRYIRRAMEDGTFVEYHL